MFAADCPTKRAAFMTDMTLGRRSQVPALWTSFLQFFGYGSRLSLQPDTRFLLHGFRNLTIIFYWVFVSLFIRFSPFQNAELRMDNFDLGLILPFTLSSWEFR